MPANSIFNIPSKEEGKEEHDIVEENIDNQEGLDQIQFITDSKDKLDTNRRKKLRGIKTTMGIVDTYVSEVFKKVKESEDEFIENLSTPLNKDPLEILLHLQNVYID